MNVYRDRIGQIIDNVLRVARGIDPSKFSIEDWSTTPQGGECGSVHCIIGWCMFDSWFNKRGLSSTIEQQGKEDDCSPLCNGEHNWNGVFNFFRETGHFDSFCPEELLVVLFSGGSYCGQYDVPYDVPLQEVIDRIALVGKVIKGELSLVQLPEEDDWFGPECIAELKYIIDRV
jgi:hypothetical protein